jgi:DNA repair photolyase
MKKAPLIISASRATDIPAFHAEWLRERLEAGFVERINPFNRKPSIVSLKEARVFVFWSKNPKPMFPLLEELEARGVHSYFQFTLNDYDAECYEPGIPKLAERVKTFMALSKRLGKERVIWRFDPLLLTEKVSVDTLLKKVERVGDLIHAYTSRFVFSFADIVGYKRVQRHLRQAGVKAREFSLPEMEVFAAAVEQLNQRWGLSVSTCSEMIDLERYGIEHGRCIDDRLLVRLFPQDAKLMAFLGYEQGLGGEWVPIDKKRKLKDPGQRKACGCVVSKDIGRYDTCTQGCVYCYACSGRCQ